MASRTTTNWALSRSMLGFGLLCALNYAQHLSMILFALLEGALRLDILKANTAQPLSPGSKLANGTRV
eukprot:3063023-Pleurochrysis_carterae.AAC.1